MCGQGGWKARLSDVGAQSICVNLSQKHIGYTYRALDLDCFGHELSIC